MIDQAILKSSFIGRDGYRWWLGQVPPNSTPSQDTWGERVPVRILGYHPEDGSILPDDQLPLALISKPTTAGAGNRASSAIEGGEFVIGFFLDGDDGQQPIITGVIDKSVSRSEISSTDANNRKSTGFFSTNYYSQNNIPAWRVSAAQKNPDPEPVSETLQTVAGGGDGNNQGRVTESSGKDNSSNERGDDGGAPVPSNSDSEERDKLDEPIIGPNNCGKSDVARVRIALAKIVSIIKGVKKYYQFYVVGTLNKITDVIGQIRNAIRDIAAVARTLVQRARNYILRKIKAGIKDIFEIFFGDELKDLKDGILAVILDQIFCIFQQVIEDLPSLIGDFIAGIIGELASAPVCAAEQFLNALLNNIASKLDELLKGALDALGTAFGEIAKISGEIFGAVDAILGLLGFLCLEKKCIEIVQFNASPWAGPTKALRDDYKDFLNDFDLPPNLRTTASNWLDKVGFKKGADLGCNKEPEQCGPPEVNIFAGIPVVEARYSAVVNQYGQVVGAVGLDRGKGYKSTPFVTFDDRCGRGYGAAGYCVVNPDDGGIDRIVITHPGYGYLPVPDGSNSFSPVITDPGNPIGDPGITTAIYIGNDGEVITYPSSPIVGPNPEQSFDPDSPPTGGYEYVPPGGNVGVEPGGDWPFDPDNPVDVVYPAPSPGSDNPGFITTSVVGCLESITVLDTGFGYSSDDELVTIPEIPGLELKGLFTEFGQIVGVEITGRVCGFIGIPEIRINSETGAGAQLRAQLTFIILDDYLNESSDVILDQNDNKVLGGPLEIIKCVI
jgi:hypothetical protein